VCLDNLTKEKVADPGFGWKVFHNFGIEQLGGDWHSERKLRPINRWLHERNYRDQNTVKLVTVDSSEEYPLGWHIFIAKKASIAWKRRSGCRESIIRKVQYKKVVAVGRQSNEKIIVARWIKILPGKNEK
jgi:hypothetical protein